MTDDVDRLRRQLRALTAVNRQLHAQLEGTGGRAIAPPPGARAEAPDLLAAVGGSRPGRPVRRSGVGEAWLEELAAHESTAAPVLVRHPDGSSHVVEGTMARRVRAGLLITALEAHLGPRRAATEDEAARWSEGPPVEVLEGPSGPPFVVVGGHRLPLRGLPLPHPVGAEAASGLPTGPELNVTPRSAGRTTFSARRLAGRVKRSIERSGGVAPAAASFARRRAGLARRQP